MCNSRNARTLACASVRWLAPMAVALIAACGAPPVQREPQLPVAPTEPPAPARHIDHARVDALLDAAARALAEQRLLTPAEDNAYLHYTKVLELVPDQPDARRGFERIVEAYLALARRALERERWAAAHSMLDRAARVDGTHPGIAPLRRQTQLLAGAERLALPLDRAALRQRRADVAARLKAFGGNARRANARVTIRAGSDADGRWIYEQLSRAPGGRRIRARMDIGVPPQVTILLLPTAPAETAGG